MSANKRSRSNTTSSNNSSDRQQQQMPNIDPTTTTNEMPEHLQEQRLSPPTTATDDETNSVELWEMPRICRSCCKEKKELIYLFGEGDGAFDKSEEEHLNASRTPSPPRRRKTSQQRNSDDPIDYALNGARCGMDIVHEQMLIWQLNISRDDGLPQEICRQCTAQYVMVGKFRRQSVRNQHRLRTMSQRRAEEATECHAQEVTRLEGNADMAIGAEPPEKLMQTPRVMTPDTPQKPAMETSSSAENCLENDDYMHLPESQMERECRLKQQQQQEEEEEEEQLHEAKTDDAMEQSAPPTPPKRRPEPKTEQPDDEGSDDQAEDALELEELANKVPWKTKAARKEIGECCTSPNPEHLASSSQASPEHLSDLSVEPCVGFDIDDTETTPPPNETDSLIYPKIPLKPKVNSSHILRRSRRRRWPLTNYVPAKRLRLSRKKAMPEAKLLEPQQLQFEELSSSTEPSQMPVEPERPAECGADKEQLLVRIPLESLSEQLQRKVCNDGAVEREKDQAVAAAASGELNGDADDVNNNENVENFCQSATADSFNSAAALKLDEIEANAVDRGDAAGGADQVVVVELPLQVAETPPPDFELEIQAPRCAASHEAADFFAEFEKHCQNSLQKLEVVTPAPISANAEAKRQLEVEMNDVETTLNGILNEMQDQHIFTPVCPHGDEFLTPADYAPLTEQETPVKTDGILYETNGMGKPTAGHSTDLFDNAFPGYEVFPQAAEGNGSAQSELIGFQNDIPCFGNIEAASERPRTTAAAAAQNSLHLELTQLLNELQPAQAAPQPAPPVFGQANGAAFEPAGNYQTTYATDNNGSSSNAKLQVIAGLPAEAQAQLNLYTEQQQAPTQQLLPQQTQLQWSTVGGLEAIKTTDNNASNNTTTTTTTTYYISSSDLYAAQQPSQAAQLDVSYATLQQPDSNENYLEQSPNNQPIMILIQQPELSQPMASASNPHQAPLQIYGAPVSNELHHQQHLQKSVLNLQQHQELLPALGKGRKMSLKCRFCQNGPRFTNSLEYSKHIIELHPAIAPFNCPHCPLSFAGRSKRSQHILSHHFVQRYQCGQCTQMFPAQRALDLHLQRYHALNEPPKLMAPGEAAVRVEDVQLQLAEQQQQAQVLELPMRSEINTTNARCNKNSHNNTRKTRILCCPDCEDCTSADGVHRHAQFEELTTMQTPPTVLTPPSTIASSLPSPLPMGSTPHITLPSPEQSEPDSTTTLRQYRKHRCSPAPPLSNGHSATANYTQSQVTSASPSSSPSSSTTEQGAAASLPIGELRASFRCIYCEERFTNDIALRKHHQLAHGAQTTMPFVCSICKRGFRLRTALHRHMETHDAEGRPYECNVCRVRFPRPSQLTLHKITVHLLSKPHTCDECGKQFGTESALKTHIKFHGAHMNSHLPMGVFLNEETKAAAASSKSTAETSNSPAVTGIDDTAEQTALTPLSTDDGLTSSIGMSPAACASLESAASTP